MKGYSQNLELNKKEKKKNFEISFTGGLNYVNQTLNSNNLNSLFIYNIDYNKNSKSNFGIGEFIGLRVDRNTKNRITYGMVLYLNHINASHNFNNLVYNDLFYSYQTNFQPANSLMYTTLTTFLKYNIIKLEKHDYSFVFGPSISFLNKQYGNNEISSIDYYQSVFPKLFCGFELSKKSSYKVFLHYSSSITQNSFTVIPLNSKFNQIEFGVSINTKNF